MYQDLNKILVSWSSTTPELRFDINNYSCTNLASLPQLPPGRFTMCPSLSFQRCLIARGTIEMFANMADTEDHVFNLWCWVCERVGEHYLVATIITALRLESRKAFNCRQPSAALVNKSSRTSSRQHLIVRSKTDGSSTRAVLGGARRC